MSSGGISSAASAAATLQTKDRANHPSPQQPARFLMPWNRPRTAATGDGDALPEWKLHCLCAEQSLLSPTIRGGLHISGGWF
ncbi:hypothetical protein M5K25_004879 [Dendrobium thyrsiflorum]|uniref:Uncharacterized protein n=1 Tax=Dendrobium thyrsiflorum TaxID=117978 RepID=A0ABD0VG70_DENTH